MYTGSARSLTLVAMTFSSLDLNLLQVCSIRVPGQLVEYNFDALLQLSHRVTCSSVSVPPNYAGQVEFTGIEVGAGGRPDVRAGGVMEFLKSQIRDLRAVWHSADVKPSFGNLARSQGFITSRVADPDPFISENLNSIFNFFRHNFVVFAGGDAITNMIMTRHPFTPVESGSAIQKYKIRIRIRNKSFRIRNPDYIPHQFDVARGRLEGVVVHLFLQLVDEVMGLDGVGPYFFSSFTPLQPRNDVFVSSSTARMVFTVFLTMQAPFMMSLTLKLAQNILTAVFPEYSFPLVGSLAETQNGMLECRDILHRFVCKFSYLFLKFRKVKSDCIESQFNKIIFIYLAKFINISNTACSCYMIISIYD